MTPPPLVTTGTAAPGAATEPATPVLDDISTPTHVHDLVIQFYREIVFDDVLEPVFGEVAEVDWAEHIPKLIDYWCWILFGTGRPSGMVTIAHRHLHGLSPIQPIHCDRWYQLWRASVDQRWSGPTADKAKDHAATLMSGMAKRIFGFSWERPDPR